MIAASGVLAARSRSPARSSAAPTRSPRSPGRCAPLRAPLGIARPHAQRPRLRPDVRRRPAPRGHAGGARGARGARRAGDVLPRRRAGRAQPVAGGRDRRRRARRSACTATATATSCGSSPRAVRDDIERGAARIEETTGRPIERYRPPYGIFNAAALALVHRNGWRPLLWTHWGRDWQARATPESIATTAGRRRRARGLGAAAPRRRRLRRPARGGGRRPRCRACSPSSSGRGLHWTLDV